MHAGGGDPVMFQHIFWFFGHPEVYILILPAFGSSVSQIIPTFARKAICLAMSSMVYATASIALLSFRSLGTPHVHELACRSAGELLLHVCNDADFCTYWR